MEKQGYVIRLSEKETDFLSGITQRGDVPEKTKTRARILLACHEKGCGQKTRLSEIAEALGVSRTTVQNVRADYKEGGCEYALCNKQSLIKCKGKTMETPHSFAEKLREMIKEEPPEGREKWSVRLLCAECEKRGYAKHVAVGTMFKILKENGITL